MGGMILPVDFAPAISSRLTDTSSKRRRAPTGAANSVTRDSAIWAAHSMDAECVRAFFGLELTHAISRHGKPMGVVVEPVETASPSVGLPMISCYCSTGTRLVTKVAARWWRSSGTSRSSHCSASARTDSPKSSKSKVYPAIPGLQAVTTRSTPFRPRQARVATPNGKVALGSVTQVATCEAIFFDIPRLSPRIGA